MSAAGPYNDVVRALFENPDHAGILRGEYTRVLVSDVSESDSGARIVMFAGIAGGQVAEMRFQVWGCPHLIAAAEKLCRACENGPVSGLSTIDTNKMMQKLSVPDEKMGKMLLLEDGLRLLFAQHGCAE